MNYITISSQNDIIYLMKKCNFFHDFCLVDLRYVSGCKYIQSRGISPVNKCKEAVLTFIGQTETPLKIRLILSNLEELYIRPASMEYDALIHEARFEMIDQGIYWNESKTVAFDSRKEESSSYFVAEEIKYMVEIL